MSKKVKNKEKNPKTKEVDLKSTGSSPSLNLEMNEPTENLNIKGLTEANFPSIDTQKIGELEIDADLSLHSEYADRIVGREVKILFIGTSVDSSVVNAIRRTVLTKIPIYGISESTTIIEKNGTRGVFNDDFMRQRLSMLPVKGVKSKVKYLEKAYHPYVFGPYGLIYPDESVEQPRDPKDKYDIKLQIKVNNKSEEVRNVTTSDIELYINGEKKKNPYDPENPGLIVRLRRGQEFHSTSTAILGIAELHESWACVAKAIHEQLEPNNYLLTVTGLDFDRQLDEYTCLKKSCEILLLKLEVVKESIDKQIRKAMKKQKLVDNDDLKMIILVIKNEDHTLGDLISTALRRHKKVAVAGYCMKHPQETVIEIGIMLNSGKFQKVVDDTFKYLEDLMKLCADKIGVLRDQSTCNGEDTEKEDTVKFKDKKKNKVSQKGGKQKKNK